MVLGEGLRPTFEQLDHNKSIKAVENSSLSPTQLHLSRLILTEGRSYLEKFLDEPDLVPIMDVTRFLNHRVDGKLLQYLRTDMGRRIQDQFTTNLLITAATSGIAITTAMATYDHQTGTSVLYARKGDPPITMQDAGIYFIDSSSYTQKGKPIKLFVAKDCILPSDQVVIVDEFLDTGKTSWALAELVKMAGAKLVGAAYVIEKSFSGGRKLLEQELGLIDEQIISLLNVEQEGDGWMKVQGIDKILTFSRQNQHS